MEKQAYMVQMEVAIRVLRVLRLKILQVIVQVVLLEFTAAALALLVEVARSA